MPKNGTRGLTKEDYRQCTIFIREPEATAKAARYHSQLRRLRPITEPDPESGISREDWNKLLATVIR
jgi:hypothetical protein